MFLIFRNIGTRGFNKTNSIPVRQPFSTPPQKKRQCFLLSSSPISDSPSLEVSSEPTLLLLSPVRCVLAPVPALVPERAVFSPVPPERAEGWATALPLAEPFGDPRGDCFDPLAEPGRGEGEDISSLHDNLRHVTLEFYARDFGPHQV